MIYNFHHFYYWLKGGVETGQAYRARIFRDLGLDAKFIFATTFPNHNIQHETEYLGFRDSEVIWMYSFLRIAGYLRSLTHWNNWKIPLKRGIIHFRGMGVLLHIISVI